MQKELFEGMETGHVDDPMENYEEYDRVFLSDQDNGDRFTGNPIMVEPFTYEFDNIETERLERKHKTRLCIVMDGEQYLEIGINLKKDDDIQKNIRKGSILFDLLSGLMIQRDPDSMKGVNVFKQVNLMHIREYINNLNSMTIEVVTKTGKFKFNTFKVADIQE